MSDRRLSIQEIPEHLGVSKNSVYVWTSKKSISADLATHLWKLQQSQVDQWVKAGGVSEEAGVEPRCP